MVDVFCKFGIRLTEVKYNNNIYISNVSESSSDQFIDCRSTQQCRRSYIACVDNQHCEIDCGYDDQACQSSIILCPENGSCHVNCDTVQACENTQIRAENSNTLTIECNDYNESCKDLSVYCPQNKGSKKCNISGFDGLYFYFTSYVFYI